MSKRPRSNRHSRTNSRRTFLRGLGLTGAAAIMTDTVPGIASTEQFSFTRLSSDGRMTGGDRFRKLLGGPDPIVSPIIYDLMSAKLVQHVGFPTMFAGGQPTSNAMYGMGDYGLVTISELLEFASRVAAAVDVPIMADADDGGGNPMNVYRAIKRYTLADVGCVMIEDMTGAKHVPDRPEGPMVSIEGMVNKVKAALDARGTDGPVLLARTDALSAKESFDKALERLVAYAQAGAEAVFMPRATPEQCARIADATGKPVMSAVPTSVSVATLTAHKVKIPVYGLQLFALKAVQEALQDLRKVGRVPDNTKRELSPDVYAVLQDSQRWSEISQRFNAQGS